VFGAYPPSFGILALKLPRAIPDASAVKVSLLYLWKAVHSKMDLSRSLSIKSEHDFGETAKNRDSDRYE
jgi:hypothetical protein